MGCEEDAVTLIAYNRGHSSERRWRIFITRAEGLICASYADVVARFACPSCCWL